MSDSEHPFDHEWTREHVHRADTPRAYEAFRQMCALEGDIPPPLNCGNRFWPSDDDFRKAWRVDEEGIWLPQKLASDWPDIFWHHVVPRLDLESTLSLGQASVECRERVLGEVRAEHLHEKVLHNYLERSIAFEERVRTQSMLLERDRYIVWDFDLKRPNTPMYMAIRGNHSDAILLLHRAGFEITCEHLAYAVKCERGPALSALLQHGQLQHGSSYGVANVQDEGGNTVLHRMAMMDDEDFCFEEEELWNSTDQRLDHLLNLLKSAGADRTIWNHDGFQAWHLTQEYPPGHRNENSTFAQTAIRLEML